MYYYCPIIIAILGLFVIILGATFTLFLIPYYKSIIFGQHLQLVEQNDIFKYWHKPEKPTKVRFHIFNIINSADVMAGAKPMFEEVGPYVYDRFMLRKIYNIEEKTDTIEYLRKYTFEFDAEESGENSEDDLITVINPLLMIMLTSEPEKCPSLKSTMNEIFYYLFQNDTSIFMQVSVKELLFKGFTLKTIKGTTGGNELNKFFKCLLTSQPRFLTSDSAYNTLTFSFMRPYNGLSVGPFAITRGVNNTKRNHFVSVDNPKIWGDKYCDMINGSDLYLEETMEVYPDRLYTFRDDFCRSIFFEFKGEIFYHNMNALKYQINSKLFDYSEDNQCFCPVFANGFQKCPPSGSMNLLRCWQIEFLLSGPYANLDPTILLDFTRLNREDYFSYVIIEPISGVPLTWFVRYQINIPWNPVPEIDLYADYKSTTIYPFLWVEEEFNFPEDQLTQIEKILKIKNMVLNVCYATVFLGILILVLSTILMMKREESMCFDKGPGLMRFKEFEKKRQKKKKVVMVKSTKEYWKKQNEFEERLRMNKLNNKHRF